MGFLNKEKIYLGFAFFMLFIIIAFSFAEPFEVTPGWEETPAVPAAAAAASGKPGITEITVDSKSYMLPSTGAIELSLDKTLAVKFNSVASSTASTLEIWALSDSEKGLFVQGKFNKDDDENRLKQFIFPQSGYASGKSFALSAVSDDKRGNTSTLNDMTFAQYKTTNWGGLKLSDYLAYINENYPGKTLYITVENLAGGKWIDSEPVQVYFKPVSPAAPAEEKKGLPGWDTWEIFEKQAQPIAGVECSTIVECLARIDRWLIESLKKKSPVSEADFGSIKVFIDAGHCDKFPGAAYEGVKEEQINIQVSLKLKAVLKEKGFNVGMSRENGSCLVDGTKSDDDLNERPRKANSFFEGTPREKRIFISIHNNSTATGSCPNTSASWVEYANTQQSTIKFAEYFETSLKKLSPNVRLCTDIECSNKNLRVIRGDTEPITDTGNKALLELEFICNSQNAVKITSEAWQQKAAQAIADGVIDFVIKAGLASSGRWHAHVYATTFGLGEPGAAGRPAYASSGGTITDAWNEACPKGMCAALPIGGLKGRNIEVCNEANGKCATVKMGDVGPWCTNDSAYVNGNVKPFAEINKGRELCRIAVNPSCPCQSDPRFKTSNGAGIDLGHGVERELGMSGSGYVKWRFVDSALGTAQAAATGTSASAAKWPAIQRK